MGAPPAVTVSVTTGNMVLDSTTKGESKLTEDKAVRPAMCPDQIAGSALRFGADPRNRAMLNAVTKDHRAQTWP